MAKRGRPTTITEEKKEYLLAGTRQGKSINSMCHTNGIPGFDVVCDWLHRDPTFAENYARSKIEGVEHYLDQMIDLEEICLEEVRHIPEAKRASAIVQAYRLKIDNLKWIATKLLPRKYGDKLLLQDERTLPQRIQIEFVKPGTPLPKQEPDGQ